MKWKPKKQEKRGREKKKGMTKNKNIMAEERKCNRTPNVAFSFLRGLIK